MTPSEDFERLTAPLAGLLAARHRVLMTVVDLTIANVALPTIGSKLHFPESDLQRVVTAHALNFGGFLLFGGRAADLLGRRRLFIAGMAIFTGASLACALATSDTFLIIMRGIQGLAPRRCCPPRCRS
jgi:MFS family permease